ncbi:protease modulator HflK N-terminal domain-containing protein [Pseudomonas sp. CLCA07]
MLWARNRQTKQHPPGLDEVWRAVKRKVITSMG